MSFSTLSGPGTIDRMTKKGDKPEKPSAGKNASGKHKAKRIGVNFTEPWHAALRQLAARKKMPVLWYLLDLAKQDAGQAGIDTPPLPWESQDEQPPTA